MSVVEGCKSRFVGAVSVLSELSERKPSLREELLADD
jgi:hypothetical protein